MAARTGSTRFDSQLSPALLGLLKARSSLHGGTRLGAHVDIGCGPGLLIEVLHRQGLLESSIGYEPDSNYLTEAKNRCEGLSGVKFVQERIEILDSLMPEHKSLSLITVVFVAHHFTDLGKFLKSAADCLEPGGILYVTDCYAPASHKATKTVGRYAIHQLLAIDRRALRDLPHVCWQMGMLRSILLWLKRFHYFLFAEDREHVKSDLQNDLPHDAQHVIQACDTAFGQAGYNIDFMLGHSYVLTYRKLAV